MNELLEKISNRIRLIVGRCVIFATKYKDGELVADAEFLAGEKRREMEFLQQFGFISRPTGEVSGVALFPAGSRENGVIIATNGDALNKELEKGEVMVLSPHGQSIYLKSDGSVEISAASGKQIVCKNDFVCEKEVYAMAATAATRVSLSNHIHPTSVGPTSKPTPGV